MIMISREQLELNLKIYPLREVERAIYDYRDICKITYKKINNKVILIFNDIKQEGNDLKIKEEFCNYLIGISQSQ